MQHTEPSAINCFASSQNLRWIDRDEIVFDIDNRDIGFQAINNIALNLVHEGYNIEIYYAEGQKSPHLHIKNIPHLENLSEDQLRDYKKTILRKYTPLEYEPDYSLTGKHLVAEENKPHFKYHTIKKLIGTFNEDNQNFCEPELIKQVTGNTTTPRLPATTRHNGITARITQAINILDIARQFGLDVYGNKCLCPFHADNNTPSLVFYAEQGRFCCFGCQFCLAGVCGLLDCRVM